MDTKISPALLKLIAENQLSEADIQIVKMSLSMEPPDIAEVLMTSRQNIHQRLAAINKKIANQLDLGNRAEI